MSARKHSPRRWQTLDATFPDGVPQAVVDAMVEAESTIAALRDRLAEMEARLQFADRGLKLLTDAGWKTATDRDRLRAIIAGRTTPPTDAEIAAHDAAGGRWRCVVPNALYMCSDALHSHAAHRHRDTVKAARWSSVWWALDAKARPCAWPEVTT